MAIRLQFLSLVIPRVSFARCRKLPPFLSELNAEGGFVFDTAWYDQRLWCETSMSSQDADQSIRAWEERGLHAKAPDGSWADLCLAASGKGPVARCSWLSFDQSSNSVWWAEAEPGRVIGGAAQAAALAQDLARAEAAGEAAYDRMYDARRPKDEYDEAREALAEALRIARFLHRAEQVTRLASRLEHIRAVYSSQFR